MTVTVTKPQFNVRDELNSVRKKTGITGEQILRSQTLTDFYNVVGNNKNLIINGAMDVWQRGTSQVKTGNGYAYVGPDHVVTYFDGTYAKTEVTLPTGETVNAMRMTLGNSASNRPNVNFPIENGTRLIGSRPITLSWWDRGSKTAKGMQCRLTGLANAVFSAGYNYISSLPQADDISTNWKKHTLTLYPTKDLTYQHAIIEMDGVDSDWTQNDWYEITQVQLEFGTQATPFEYRHYQTELALCQRYCYALWAVDSSPYAFAGQAIATSATYACITIELPVPMRVKPNAFSLSAQSHWQLTDYSTALAGTSIGLNSTNSTVKTAVVEGGVTSGLTAGRTYVYRAANTNSAILILSAEL